MSSSGPIPHSSTEGDGEAHGDMEARDGVEAHDGKDDHSDAEGAVRMCQ